MVKNVKGGKHKNQARKHLVNIERKLRLRIHDGEMYARVTSKPGGNKLVVLCLDQATRLCTMPGKFINKGRDNVVEKGSWILVGLRDWETAKTRENCDLLEVYTDNEKQKLFTTINENWSVFDVKEVKDDTITFTNEYEEQQLEIENDIKNTQSITSELIDFNDI
uniref:S1-like domain-containing protein n=1 Tax=viral metagenome TaxID=1070528 RepID=A0A6C0HTB0_9ZZZZ